MVSISRSRPIRLNSRFWVLPPVMLPPGFIISPFNVAILKDDLARLFMAMPASRSFTTIVRPRRFSNMPLYLSSKDTRSEATPIKPSTLHIDLSSLLSSLGRMLETGSMVALPYCLERRYPITCFASCSVGVTMFCKAEPSVISIALSYSQGTRISSATTPSIHLPRRGSLAASLRTFRTLE